MMTNYKKQQGAVLLMALIFLIVITVLGVNAVNSSSIKTQVAGNNMSSMLVYTGAESALARSASDTNLFSLDQTKALGEFIKTDVPAAILPDENVANAVLTLTAQMEYQGTGKQCPVTNKATAIGFGAGFTCDVWEVTAESRLRATSAKDTHLQGIASIDTN